MDKKKLLRGVIDIHVHAGPSMTARELDAADTLEEAGVAGYHGFLVKDHYFPNMMGCQMVQRHLGSGNVRVFGSMCPNSAMGLFDLNTVDVAYGMGAKMVYFPTVSSKNHINAHKGHFAGAGKMSVLRTPVVYVDENGRLDLAAVRILEYMSKKDMALGTNHGSTRKVDALVREAMKAGMKKILVSHPHFHTGVIHEQMRQWATLGVYIEPNVCAFPESSKVDPLPTTTLGEMLREVPHDRMVLDSDMGQEGNDSPVEALYNFVCLMMEYFGVTEDKLEIIAKKNPAILMGLE